MAAPPLPGPGGYPPPPGYGSYPPPQGAPPPALPPPPGAYAAPPPGPYGYPPPGPYGAPPGAYAAPPPGPYGYPPPPGPYGAPPPPGPYGAPPPPGPYGAPPPGYPGYTGYPSYPGYPPPPAPGYPYYPPPPPGYYGAPGHYGAPGRSRSRSPRPRARGDGDGAKYTCRFFIGIPNEDDFRVARRIIGAGGSKMKDIVAKSGGDAKLRLRGKGSGYVERDTNDESPEPLQLCISCPTHEGYYTAQKATEELLLRVYDEYDSWCADRGRPERAPRIHMTEKHHASGEAQRRSGGGGGDAHGGSGGGGGGGGNGNRNRRGGKNRKKAPGGGGGNGGGGGAGSGAGGGGGGSGGPAAPPSGDTSQSMDRGTAPAGAPSPEEIEKHINDRNDARKKNDFSLADKIRDDLKARGVVLSDAQGGHGSGLAVTQWRYWHE